MTRVFQLTNSSEGSLACLSGFDRPHVIVDSLPAMRGMDALNFLYTDSFEKLGDY